MRIRQPHNPSSFPLLCLCPRNGTLPPQRLRHSRKAKRACLSRSQNLDLRNRGGRDEDSTWFVSFRGCAVWRSGRLDERFFPVHQPAPRHHHRSSRRGDLYSARDPQQQRDRFQPPDAYQRQRRIPILAGSPGHLQSCCRDGWLHNPHADRYPAAGKYADNARPPHGTGTDDADRRRRSGSIHDQHR